MKRSSLKRTSTLSRKPLCPGVKRLRRTRLKQVGKRREREREALDAFRRIVLMRDLGQCQECGWVGPDFIDKRLHAHHIVARSQAVGHELVHHKSNGVTLCWRCHDQVHRGELPQYIKSRAWLDTLLQEERTP